MSIRECREYGSVSERPLVSIRKRSYPSDHVSARNYRLTKPIGRLQLQSSGFAIQATAAPRVKREKVLKLINRFELKTLTDKAVPTLACLALLQMQLPSLDASTEILARTPATPRATDAPNPEQRRLRAFVETLYAEGAIEKLEPCRRWDACLSVTTMFEAFPAGDKKAIAGLIRRYFQTLPGGGSSIRSVRFLDSRSGREIGHVCENRLAWESAPSPSF